MSDKYSDIIEDYIVDDLSDMGDPGERNRENHLWGDRLVIGVGNVVAWLFPILMIAIVTQVFLRKAGHNQAWLDDAQWWIYGTALLTGFAYAITTNSHVRVDIFHEHFSGKKKARIEAIALGWFLLPFLAMMTDILIQYAFASYLAREGSDSPNGLHMLYLLKGAMPLLFGLAILATFSAMIRNIKQLTTPHLWHLIIAGFPGMWFFAERALTYSLWWFIRLSNPELAPRRIAREDVFDQTLWYGLTIVIVIFVISFVMSKRNSAKS
ncbi:MAG TPA: TRAP transporter small permease subunit [Devosia sp.]|nr:TRAP transporter small permease subunit [Devosia sp.]